MTDEDFIATVLKIVEDKQALERYVRTRPPGPERDLMMVSADAFQEVENLVRRSERATQQAVAPSKHP